VEAGAESGIGKTLRAVRRRQRLSLAQVAARSGNEFKASSLGAYERGDRAISVSRLQRLAAVYGVSPEVLMQPERNDVLMRPARNDVIDLVRLENQELSGLVLDLSRFRASDDPRLMAVMKFATAIRSIRTQPTTSVIVVRRSDAAFIASLLGCDPVDLDQQLRSAVLIAKSHEEMATT
jgi:transcriptional regulator with XRE-family HTH domain